MPSQEQPKQANFVSMHVEQSQQQERLEEEEGIIASDLTNILNAFGRTQREMVDTIKQLVSTIQATKPSEQPNNEEQQEKVSHEESAVVKESAAAKEPDKRAPSFVTQEDVVAMLEKELHHSSEDWKYAPQPPYPSCIMHLDTKEL
ncbi:hypothetical protein ACLB2K_040531 [Fragaria x ananassa]